MGEPLVDGKMPVSAQRVITHYANGNRTAHLAPVEDRP